MGCCCSRYSSDRGARTPLLQRDRPSGPFESPAKRSEPGEPYTKEQEEEVWRSIIARTTRLMIDNNNSSYVNPLHPMEVEERQAKYKDMLNRVKLPPAYSVSKQTLLNGQQGLSSVVQMLEEAMPFDDSGTDIFEEMQIIRDAKDYFSESLLESSMSNLMIAPMKKISTGSSSSQRRY